MKEIIIDAFNRDFFVSSESDLSGVKINIECIRDGLSEYTLFVPRKATGSPLTVKWCEHMTDILSFWGPTAGRYRGVKPWSIRNVNESSYYAGSPIISLIKQRDGNFSTVAVSDSVNPIKLAFSVNDFEEKENLDFHLHLFDGFDPMGDYTLVIRIDRREIPYYEAVMSVADEFFSRFYPTSRERTVNGELPLYSSWYNYHQNPIEESLRRELPLAAECGMRSLIIDDGWSYPDKGSSDYRFCGDWEVEKSKFPDLKGFVQTAHSYGIKVAIWFPVAFVGYLTKDYQRLKGKMLYNSTFLQAGVLDPRYPEVRSYITDTYIRFVKDYDLDGLKLDFIDWFKPHMTKPEDFITDKDPGTDCESVEDGVVRLNNEIRTRLTGEKPDFMIEYRQKYVGPAIVRDCNMLRVGDCPFDLVTNRVGVVDLRLLNHKDLAVHADMLIWSADEQDKTVAKMLQNILFGVPQISVLLHKSKDSHIKIIKEYVRYWVENRETLLHGRFAAMNPEACYTSVYAEDENKRIVALYSESSTFFDGKPTDIFNATSLPYIYVENRSGIEASYTVYDYYGNYRGSGAITDKVERIDLSEGYRLEIRCTPVV